jgi:3-oxoadipate enol-lactonase
MTAVALHHEISGPDDGPVLVLEGSLGTTLEMWRPQVEQLSKRFRLICVDHRGHGRSPIPPGPYSIDDLGQDVVALLDRLALERVSFVGLSIGGMVGIWLGAHAPQRIRRLALLCTSAYAPPASAWHERAAGVRASGSPAEIAEAVVSRWFTPHWAESHPEIVAAHRAMLSAADPEGYAACCEAIADFDMRSELASITAPTLVISGADDLALPPEHQRLLAEGIPGARLHTIEDAAHLANVQHPDAVNELLAAEFGS